MSVDKETRVALDAIEDAQSDVRWWWFWTLAAASVLMIVIIGAVLVFVFVGGDDGVFGGVMLGLFGGGGAAGATAGCVTQLTAERKHLRRVRRHHRDLLLDDAS